MNKTELHFCREYPQLWLLVQRAVTCSKTTFSGGRLLVELKNQSFKAMCLFYSPDFGGIEMLGGRKGVWGAPLTLQQGLGQSPIYWLGGLGTSWATHMQWRLVGAPVKTDFTEF